MTQKQQSVREIVEQYWADHYVEHDLCSLCGNVGILDTTDRAISAAGVHAGRRNFCICPNGQALRARQVDAGHG